MGTDMDVTSLRQVGLPARDLDRAVAFYRDVLAVPLIARFANLAFFDLDGVRLLVEVVEDPKPSGVLYLGADDIDAAHAELVAAGVSFDPGPHSVFRDEQGTFGSPGEEEWMAFFLDTEGNQLALSSRRAT